MTPLLPGPAGRTDDGPWKRPRWYFSVAIILLLVAAFFRLWHLGNTPPGMSSEELVNAQLSDQMREGHVSAIYEEVRPVREGLYFAALAASTGIIGRGLIVWRMPSVWFSMLALATGVSLMRRLFGVRVALLTLALMGTAFWPVWIGRVVLHVTLMPLVTVVVLYTLTRAYLAEEQTDASLWYTVGGVALGVAQYVHVTAWTLIALFMAFTAYRAILSRAELRQHWGNILYTLSLTGVLSLPMIIFLAGHPGAREPVPLAEQPGLVAEIPGRLVSSMAALVLRGDMNPNHNLPGRPIMGPLIGALMIVGIGVAAARWRRPQYGLVLLWLAVGLLPTAFLPRKPDFEFMAVVLPVVFAFPAIGLAAIFHRLRRISSLRLAGAASSAVSALVVLTVIGTAAWTYRDYFTIWPWMGDVRLSYQADLGVLARYLDTSRDSSPVSICSTPVDRSTDPFALTNQELLGYLMHRHDLPIRYFNCTQSLVIASGGESQRLIFPRGHYYDHLPGSLLAWMRFAHDERVYGVRPDVVMRLEVSDHLADVAGSMITTAPVAWPPESGTELAALPVSFEYNVAFLGYTVRDDTLRATDWVELTTYWRMDGPPPPELTVFAHLLGNPVVVIAQADTLGVDIGTLQPRDVFLQYSMIQTPGGMTPGLYPLSVGLYFPSTGERLHAFENGQARADRLFLQRITLTP